MQFHALYWFSKRYNKLKLSNQSPIEIATDLSSAVLWVLESTCFVLTQRPVVIRLECNLEGKKKALKAWKTAKFRRGHDRRPFSSSILHTLTSSHLLCLWSFAPMNHWVLAGRKPLWTGPLVPLLWLRLCTWLRLRPLADKTHQIPPHFSYCTGTARGHFSQAFPSSMTSGILCSIVAALLANRWSVNAVTVW